MQDDGSKVIVFPGDEGKYKAETEKDTYRHVDRTGHETTRVGQAALDILSASQPTYSAGDIVDAFGPKYVEEIEKAIAEGERKYTNPFYIFVLTKKEPWVTNIVRNYFVARQTPPRAMDSMIGYPNHTKTLYIVDASKGQIKLIWSLPGWDDCQSVAKHPDLYAPELVRWIQDLGSPRLNKEKYSFDEEI